MAENGTKKNVQIPIFARLKKHGARAGKYRLPEALQGEFSRLSRWAKKRKKEGVEMGNFLIWGLPFQGPYGKISSEREKEVCAMTDKMLSHVLSTEIERQLAFNQKAFERILQNALPEDCEVDPVLTRLLEETVRYSTQFTIQFLLRTLEKGDIIDLPNDGSPVLYPLEHP